MRGWFGTGLVLGVALLAASVTPAAAQTVGVGYTYLGSDGGSGFGVDYARDNVATVAGRPLALVGEVGMNHLTIDNRLFTGGVNTLLVQAGVRLGIDAMGLKWHGQLLGGMARGIVTGDAKNYCADLIDIVGDGVACGDGGSEAVFTPGFGVDYPVAGWNVRGRIEAPIIGGHATFRTWLGLTFQVGR